MPPFLCGRANPRPPLALHLRPFLVPLIGIALAASGGISQTAVAQVVINEVSASSSDRLLRWSDDGVPTLGTGAPWYTMEFDDSSWDPAVLPIGSQTAAATNVSVKVRGKTPSIYVRKTFNVSAANAGSTSELRLGVTFSDGFVAYLNGEEIARANAGAAHGFIYADQTAFNRNTNTGEQSFALGPAGDHLVPGSNLLAIHLLNDDLTSATRLDARLTIDDGPVDIVPPGSAWRYFPGLVEPSGGVFEPAFLENPEYESGDTDWVELHNTHPTEAADLTGWTLSDDKGDHLKWTFPDGTSIPPGGFLLVMADDAAEATGTTYPHTNFKLSADGEFLGLYDAGGAAIDTLDPKFPKLDSFHSYGRDPATGSSFGYLVTPTPGRANAGPVLAGRADAPDFEPRGGFHDGAVTLTLTSETPGVTIRFTIDGSEPTLANGTDYTAPLTLNPINNRTGHVIRARSFGNGLVTSRIKTHTYLINQAAQLKAVPTLVYATHLERSLYAPHGILTIVGGSYVNDQWQAGGIDSYNMAINRGRAFERPLHLEFFSPDGAGSGFRQDAGVRLAASDYSRPRMRLNQLNASPWPSNANQKPSFNLYFRNDYQDESITLPMFGEDYPVRTFYQLRARAGKNDINNPFIVDEIVRRLYIDQGQKGSRGIINALYLNGRYKGFYNTTERLREPFFQSHHASDLPWDIRQVDQIASGDTAAWQDMMSRLAANPSIEANWDAALEVLDPVAIADYFLLNIYTATWDWPQNNWVGARERSDDGKWRLYVWDAEGGFNNRGDKPVSWNSFTQGVGTQNSTLARLYQALEKSPEWRLLFADRIHKHLFNGGVLDDRNFQNSHLKAVTDQLVSEFSGLLSFTLSQTVNTSKITAWAHPTAGRRTYLLGPRRQDFRSRGLWPATAPPVLGQHGGEVEASFPLDIDSPNGGTIYYTLDGTDPREFGGAIAPGASIYADPLVLDDAFVRVKTRVRSAGGEWSALTEADFTVGAESPSTANLVVAEINYHPYAPTPAESAAGITDKNDFEFLQLQNIGAAAVDISNLVFTEGISFDFASGSVPALNPGAYAIVVQNLDAFRLRYGSGHDALIAGTYAGRLDNGGESLTLHDRASATNLIRFTYDDENGWPAAADGYGGSLLLANRVPMVDHDDPANWVASAQTGGLPGGTIVPISFDTWRERHFSAAQLADPTISGPDADPDHDGLPTLVEFGLGTPPMFRNHLDVLPKATLEPVGQDVFLALTLYYNGSAANLSAEVEVCSALEDWASGAPDTVVMDGPTPQGDGTMRVKIRDTIPATETPGLRFIRARFTAQ
ncbi:hypothetical protein BH23VER1_BH23VER1_29260 [soil metagenome]